MQISSYLGPSPWQRQWNTAAAFLVLALSLTAASGYSYGAVMLLLGAVASLPRWVRQRPDRGTLALAAIYFAMGLLWCVMSDAREGVAQWDRTAKFMLGTVCLLFIAAFPPRPRALFWGLLLGCIGAGFVALWQVRVEGAPRASGFPSNHTNAIQWGNLALLLGAMLAMQLVALWRQLPRAVPWVGVAAALMALNASVLSQSRGGWLALLLALPIGIYLFHRLHPGRVLRIAGALLAALAVLTAMNWRLIEQRWELMHQEVTQYDDNARAGAESSVGQRLEHWRFAWDLGREKPLTGWGLAGYMREKEKRVAAGLYQKSITEYIYVHNEPLDVFVKTGIGGVALLLCFYGVPFFLFWPSRRRLAALDGLPEAERAQVIGLRLTGVCIPVLYVGFGLTQVFFAHNSGIMFYLFSNMIVWAALKGVDPAAPAPATAGAAARA